MIPRRATTDDAAAIADLQVASWRDAFRGLLSDEYLDDELDAARRAGDWRAAIAATSDRDTVLVVDRDGQVVGFVHAGPSEDGSRGQLHAMHVRPDLRRQGMGFDLHDAAVRRLRSSGFDDAELWLLEENSAGRRFYERQGWTADGARRRAPDGEAFEVRYVRPL